MKVRLTCFDDYLHAMYNYTTESEKQTRTEKWAEKRAQLEKESKEIQDLLKLLEKEK